MSEIEAGKKVWYRREIWKTHSHIEAFVTGVSVTAQFCGALVLLHFFGEQPEFYWLAISLFAVLPIELYIFFEHFTPKKKVAHA